MNVGIFGINALYDPTEENTISGHIQIPIKSANILYNNGHNVTIITTDAPRDYTLPTFANNKIDVERVTNVQDHWDQKYPNKIGLLAMLRDLKTIIKTKNFDVVHFFGTDYVAFIIYILKIMDINAKCYLTLINIRGRGRIQRFLTQIALRSVDHLFSLTEFTHNHINAKNSTVSRPGIIRDMSKFNCERVPFNQYVLFWRNVDKNNGADLCYEAYHSLAESYPQIDFVFATRPNAQYESEIKNKSKDHNNIHLLHFPYEDSLSIIDLVTCARIIVLPFRKLSINPQFAILESLYSGTPVIASKVDSNSEIINNKQTGILIDPNTEDLTRSLRWALENKNEIIEMGNKAKYSVKNNWNWRSYENKILGKYE